MRGRGRFRPRFIREELNELAASGADRALAPAPLPAAGIQTVSSSQVTANMKTAYNFSEFSTTNTTDVQTLTTLDIYIPPGSQMLFFIAGVTFSHTVAGARVTVGRVSLYVDDTLNSAYVVRQARQVYVPAANARVATTVAQMYHVPTGLPLVQPGLRRMVLEVFNWDAGTLTVYGGSSETPHLSALCLGAQI